MSDLIKLPLDLNTREFHDNRQAHYKWLREKQPVCEASVSIMKVFVLSRHEDCLNILKDDRYPDLKLAVPKDHLKRQLMPGWNRYQKVPVVLG